MDIGHRNNVTVTGNPEGRTVVLAHGFGCDQNMWRLTVPALAEEYQVVLFDYVGAGRSDLSAFSEARYSSLEGYAQDVEEICEALDLRDAVFVGHSVSAMIGVLAAARVPERIGALVMVAPSPVTSTTSAITADSAPRTSTNSWRRWIRTIWGGRPRWLR